MILLKLTNPATPTFHMLKYPVEMLSSTWSTVVLFSQNKKTSWTQVFLCPWTFIDMWEWQLLEMDNDW